MNNNAHPKILIADDEPEVQRVLTRFLTRYGYEIVTASDGLEALGKAKVQKPDMVLLDVNMPGMDGFSVCQQLRGNPGTSITPILMLTARAQLQDKVNGFSLGADDYLPKPFEMEELLVRIDVLMKRSKNMIAVNPLTRLPGSPSIQEEINTRIRSKQKFAAAYIDIDNFKAYNDVYGFHQGDLVLAWTAKMLRESAEKSARAGEAFPAFVGHIGGDDFIVVADTVAMPGLVQSIADQFDGNRSMWYNVWHNLRGHIEALDRKKQPRKFPLMALSIGVASNETREITHYAEVAQITSELKCCAKDRDDKEKSFFLFDRRSAQ